MENMEQGNIIKLNTRLYYSFCNIIKSSW